MLNTILFDLDGTLVPFLQDEFIHDDISCWTRCGRGWPSWWRTTAA